MDSSPSDFGSGFERDNPDSVITGFNDENIVGESATCRVYRMRLNGIQVAVKRLKSEYRTSPIHVAAYRKEFLIGLRLKHDSLPVYRDFKESSDEVFIIMDYIDGVSLEDFVNTPEGKSYFSSIENVKSFFRELLNIVAYLHRSGVVHCDIKPSNIMLRHSDRGVMLLDLDKSYSDTLDLTSGGTPSYSAPIVQGEKPTVRKDFAAIARIIGFIEEKVLDFPTSKFKRFKNVCLSDNANESTLTALLNRKSSGRIWIAVLLTMTIVIVVVIGILNKAKNNPTDSEIHSNVLSQDSIRNGLSIDSSLNIKDPVISTDLSETPSSTQSIQSMPEPSSVSQQSQAPNTSNRIQEKAGPDLIIDIETPLAEFTSKLEDAYTELESGTSRSRLMDVMYELVMLRSPAYQKIVEDAKLQYPEIPGVDVELAVARAYEKSRPGKLYVEFNKAVSDTLRIWDNGRESDNNIQ